MTKNFLGNTAKIAATSVFFTLVVFVSTAFCGWGIESGRADLSDAGMLASDKSTVQISLRLLQEIQRFEFVQERQHELLGDRENGTKVTADLAKRTEKWFDDRMFEPSMRILRNPAASCAEAQHITSLFSGLRRQADLLGVSTEKQEKIFNDGFALANIRCREEALDECNLTGRYDQIIVWASGEGRQTQFLGGESDVGQWAEKALKECAIYELHYVSTASIKDEYTVDTKIDGRVKIEPKTDDSAVVLNDLEGFTQGGTNPFLVSIKCTGTKDAKLVCGPGGGAVTGAWAKILKMRFKHRVFYEDDWTSKDKIIDDPPELVFMFGPAIILVPSVVTNLVHMKGIPDVGDISVPMEAGGVAFNVAHNKSRKEEMKFEFTSTRRGVYPVLFELETSVTDTESSVTASDATTFELIHKPNKQPFEPRIDKGAKPRVPFKPKSPN